MSDKPAWFEGKIDDDIFESSLFQLNLVLPSGKQVLVHLANDIDIDYEQLETLLCEIPSQYVFWASLYSEIKMRVAVIETKIRKRKKIVASATMAKAQVDKMKFTDKQLAVLLEGDSDLTKLDLELAIAQKQCGKLWHMIEAIKMRSEHCRSLAGFKRQDKEQSTRMT